MDADHSLGRRLSCGDELYERFRTANRVSVLPMIRHCVFVRFRSDVATDEVDSIMAGIENLTEEIPGMSAVHVGDNVNPEGLDKGYSRGFMVDFADARARDVYLEAPAHKAIGSRLVAAAEGGADGIFVYDMEVE